MIKNYFKIAFRSLVHNSTFTLINVAGLALGIAVFLFIMQYVANEWGANRFHKNYDNLYRANMTHPEGGSEYYLPPGFAPVLKNSFPDIKNVIRIADGSGNGLISVPNPSAKNNGEPLLFREEKVSYVDGDFFKVFSFQLVKGSNSLSEPKTAALSASTAKKYFGKTNPIGKTLTIDNQFGHTLYTVTSVYEDIPEQSDIKADFLLSLKTLENPALRNENDWADPNGLESAYVNMYFLLKANSSQAVLVQQINQLKNRLQPKNKAERIVLQPLSNMHLAPSFTYHLQSFGSLLLVSAFIGVALLILLIAWVNYINLSVAQSLNRSREIGIRKVLGAMRKQLIIQFLSETIAVTITSIGIAFLLVYLFQPIYNNFLGKKLSLSVLNQGWFWFVAFLLTVLGSLLSGGYVAIVLSSFKPVKTLSGKAISITGGLSFRKSLVVFQFMISVVFIIATLVLYKQLSFMKQQDLGMQINQRLVVVGPAINGGKVSSQSFKNQLGQLPFVEKYAASNDIPGRGYNFSAVGITRLNPNPGDEKKSFSMLQVDDRYFGTYGIQFAQGQNFSTDAIEKGYRNSPSIIINQKAAEQFGFKPGENIIGQKISWGKTYEIAGVVKNYHHLSLHQLISPMIFLPAVSSGYYTIKLNTANVRSKIDQIKKIYQAQFPGNPFEYFFLDENYDKQYQTEQKLGNVFIISAFVAVFIACLGLFGMASFTSRQRTKEIGIRKVLGASVISVIKLITADFLKLVLIAIVIASPIAGYIMNKWLQDFAYRIAIQWWLFVIAGGIAVAIALITVSFQSVKAALANPVNSLRSE